MALSALLGSRRYVASIEDFEKHVKLHVARVRRLGNELLTLFPRDFGGLSPNELSKYLALHDRSKLVAPGPDPKRLTKALFAFYGTHLNELSGERQAAALRDINEVNELDRALSRRHFEQEGYFSAMHGRLDSRAASLLRIEMIADFVDRSRDPVASEEFHRIMRPAWEYLGQARDQELAFALESRYSSLVRGLEFSLS